MTSRKQGNSKKRRRRGLRRGFTLIEVAIAMGMLAIAGVGTIGLLTSMMRANRDSRLRTESATLARQTIDELISSTDVAQTPQMMFEMLEAAGYCSGAYAAGYTCTPASTTHGALTRTVRIGPSASGAMPVSIRISWQRTSGTNTLRFNINLPEPE